jgi:FdhD protein
MSKTTIAATGFRPVVRIDEEHTRRVDDELVVEDPLEIFVDESPYALTMRTPGHDRELVAGFCFTEGLISGIEDIESLDHCPGSLGEKRMFVALRHRRASREASLRKRREFISQSSCGLCGKESLAEVHTEIPPVSGRRGLRAAALPELRKAMEARQVIFARTGATHCAAIFAHDRSLLAFAEDVGRHNALDKAIGQTLLTRTRDRACLAMVSSRLSYEMIQKAGMLGIEILCGFSAASRLAVDLAESLNMTLVGFLRGARMSVYTGYDRILTRSGAEDVQGLLPAAAGAAPHLFQLD